MKPKQILILMLSVFNGVCVASVTETMTNIASGENSGRVVRLALRNPMHDTSLYDLINSARQQVSELQLENSNELVAWVEQNIVPRVRSHLEEHSEIARLLEENARIELSSEGSLEASDTNPIVMIIDRWANQTAEDAVISSILYPASVPMQGDECDYRDPQHLRRLALSSLYGNPLAYHHLALWAHMNRPDTYGLPRDRELFSEEVLYNIALQQFEEIAGDLHSSALNDFQRRTLLVCMRDLRPGARSSSAFEISGTDENADPRLLFNIGISGKNNKESLIKSRKKGFLKARFHETRYIRDKTVRTQELQRLKKSLSINKKRSRSIVLGEDLFERVITEVNRDLARLEDKHVEKKPKKAEAKVNLSSEQISSTSRTILEIINKK